VHCPPFIVEDPPSLLWQSRGVGDSTWQAAGVFNTFFVDMMFQVELHGLPLREASMHGFADTHLHLVHQIF